MNKLVTGLCLALLAIAIVAVHLWREVRTEREQNTALEVRVAALEPAKVLPSPGTATPPSVSLHPVAAQDAAATAAPPAPAKPPASAANPIMAEIGQSMNTPEGREYTRAMTRMMLEQQHPDLATVLNLSPEEAGKFLDLLAKHAADVGADSASLLSGATRDRAAREEMARQLAAKEQAHEAEAAAMLGSNYPKWKEYELTAAGRQREKYERQAADQLRNAVSSSSDPLSDTQFQALNGALAAEQKRIDQDSRGLSMQQQAQRLGETNRRLVDVAATHLNAGQLERYQQHLEQQAAQMRAVAAAVGAMGSEQD